MKKTLIMAAVAMVCLTACNDNNDILDEQPVVEKTGEQQGSESDGPTVPLNVTALSTTDESNDVKQTGRRSILPTVTTTGVTMEWENSDKIEVLLGDAMTKTQLSMSEKQTTQKAIFGGDIATGGQEVTASTPLYSYVASEDITFNSASGDVTIDLSDQDGTITDAVRHSLLLGETVYGNGNVTFNYTNRLAIMELKFRAVNGENGRATVSFSADQGIPASVTYDPATGNVKAVGSTSGAQATNVLFEEGEATCYIAIAPNTAGANNVDINNARVRVTFNNNGRFYEQAMKVTTIPAGSIEANLVYEQRVKNPLIPIGSWLFSDGSWGEKNVAQPEKTIVGIIYDNQPTAEDAALGYTHGYAIALEDIATGKWWSGMNLDIGYGYLGVKYDAAPADAVAALIAEPSGLKYSADATAKPDAWTVHAPKIAYEYIVVANMHSFLPTAGHIYKMLVNLGGLSADALPTVGRSGTGSEAEEIKFMSAGSSVYQNLGQSGVLNIDAGMTSNAPINGNFTNDEEYWTSTQCDNNEAYCFTISTSVNNWIFFDAENKPGTSKTTRACIAF